MLPSEESATPAPNSTRAPISSAPVSFEPCWVQVEPERVNTHAAPGPSSGPPTSAVLPSEESATLAPNLPGNFFAPGSSLISPLPVSFDPCCFHSDPDGSVNTQAAPTPLLSPGAPISAVLGSAELEDSATLKPNSPGANSLLTSPLPVSFLPCCA